MSIFGWREQNVKNLKKVIVEQEKVITDLRDAKIEAQISESRVQSGFNAQKEADRSRAEINLANVKAAHNIEINTLTRTNEILNADFNKALKLVSDKRTAELEKEFAAEKAAFKKEMEATYKSELADLKKSDKKNSEDAQKYQGLYNGTLLVVKALESQVKTFSGIIEDLTDALPEVKANLTGGNQSVTVNK